MSEHITGEIKEIGNKMNQRLEAQMPPVNPPPPGTVRFVDVQIYDVPVEELPEDLCSVESTVVPEEDNTADPSMPDGNQGEPSQETQETPEKGTGTRKRLHPFPLVLAILCMLFAAPVSVVYVLPFLKHSPSATVTIIPDSMQITTTTTVSVV